MWGEAKQVLVFNSRKKLIMYATSVSEISKALKLRPGNISKACRGDLISYGNYYFRYIENDVEIEMSDFGTLSLSEYDSLCGIKRAIYPTQRMRRKQIKNFKYEIKNED